MDVVELKKGIAELYDESSGLWENIWGDHMHHGYYDPNADVSRSPQLEFPRIWWMWDVGSEGAPDLASKYGANAKGITLSPVQAERANALAAAQGLANQASFQVADALNQPFPDGEFDLVWSMESGEHMPDKAKFVNEMVRVAAP
ncbi:tocopherol O-methyltransferase, chloroplastic-like [Pyrus x bretschneideri]|uniref:tocopherol O-methyltransferase, chloroplastic-like n=1 Tax=Pyrus x bretschneideri TaxID=225117 RepID=UPI002030212E|nr:tocopherol O-methyltransferase, chloroplastic-like [Pyrus x bretschneideri]